MSYGNKSCHTGMSQSCGNESCHVGTSHLFVDESCHVDDHFNEKDVT